MSAGCPFPPPLPPKPASRAEKVSFWAHLRLFRRDILSAQPERLYRAKMAAFRTPFFRSYLCNDPQLVDLVLKERPDDFPKSDRIRAGLAPLLGRSVFLTNGDLWKRQRRIIDPAFEGGRLKDGFGAMQAAGIASVARLGAQAGSGAALEIEAEMSHLAADVIFRTLFSIPIEDRLAADVFDAFRRYQRSQPILNLAAFLPLPRWFPRFYRPQTRAAAREIRRLITALCARRAEEIAAGRAPDDLATKIMTTKDPLTGAGFETAEMVDQVAIFFLAGHETSASALSWALYLLATHPDLQEAAAAEALALGPEIGFGDMGRLKQIRDIFRETLRLYPPVPMMVRENSQEEVFRGRDLRKGAQIVLSPWHLHRHSEIWQAPDDFCPHRWQSPEGKASARKGFMPFSAGPRVCTGAGFAMLEGVLLLALLLRAFRFEPVEGAVPVPVAHLTVRAKDGIHLRLVPRARP